MRARSAARAALNVMQDELRMVSDGGLRAASPDSITVRVPLRVRHRLRLHHGRGPSWERSRRFRVGRERAVANGHGLAGLAGRVAFRRAGDRRQWRAGRELLDQYADHRGAEHASWAPQHYVTATGTAPTVGAPVYFYQEVTYLFGPSVDQPGKRALWRAVPSAGLREELVAPFDTSARFEFLVGSVVTARSTPPSDPGLRARRARPPDRRERDDSLGACRADEVRSHDQPAVPQPCVLIAVASSSRRP